jgi:hypothetical protein
VDNRDKDVKAPVVDQRWQEAQAVKGTAADMRRSVATVRDQVAKDSRLFSHGDASQQKKRG